MEPREFGQWVFGLKGCPKEATAAVVNRDGTFAWWRGTHPEEIRVNRSQGGWSAGGRAIGSWSHGGSYRVSNKYWDSSLIFREELKNKASASAVIMAE